LSAEAQQQVKKFKIGFLGTRRASGASASPDDAFERMLREIGYVEGKNIAFEYRSANNKLDRLPALATELVRLKVDLLFTPGTNNEQGGSNLKLTS
jgi:putative ABC transport system substrate-binding protein